ncbi:hypothetical protein PV677_36385 [Streptomyces sp. DE06-01C]|uniref:hypothetical protein n=1 Tax=Streptomyces sp. DE06-01C TaxID=3028656 RepID=UPI0029C4470E|nr:hypothetical protein [Streptomyces sp. DE06-01C]MDX5526150.1 hypothetical protein [Streptomyces sp. DE06-01C]
MTEKTPAELWEQRARLIASTGLTETVLRERADAHQLYPEHHDIWRTVEGIDYLLSDTTDEPAEPLASLGQVGWYCWRCHGIVAQACRSDNVPVHVPADWQEEMTREIAEQENEEPCEGDTLENAAWCSVWLHGKWRYLTQKMSTPEREYAADRVASYCRHLAECDNDPERGEPDGLRWWREAGR